MVDKDVSTRAGRQHSSMEERTWESEKPKKRGGRGARWIDDVTLSLSQTQCDPLPDCPIVVLQEVRDPAERHQQECVFDFCVEHRGPSLQYVRSKRQRKVSKVQLITIAMKSGSCWYCNSARCVSAPQPSTHTVEFEESGVLSNTKLCQCIQDGG